MSPGPRQCDDGNENGSDVGRLHSGHATSNDGRPDRVMYSELTSYPLHLPLRRPLPRVRRLIDSAQVVTLTLLDDDRYCPLTESVGLELPQNEFSTEVELVPEMTPSTLHF